MDETAAKTLETEVLEHLEAAETDYPFLFAKLDTIPRRQHSELKTSLAEFIADKALNAGNHPAWLEALSRVEVAKEKQDQLRASTIAKISEVIGKGADIRCFLEQSGLSKDEAFPVAAIRMSRLLQIKNGVQVYDRTWGSGVVSDVDHFYGRITVDFDKKKFHELAMSYAADSLEILNPDHLLARKRNEPEVIEEMIKKKPDEIVRLIFSSFGPMSVAVLQETVVNHLVPEAGWKKFWEGARRGLKKDPLIKIPTKRNDLIEIAHQPESFDDAWFSKFLVTRRIPELFDGIDALLAQHKEDLNEHARSALGNRLAHIVKGSMNRPELVVRSVMTGYELDCELPGFNMHEAANSLLQPECMTQLFERMNSRDVGPLFEKLLEKEPELLPDLLVELVPVMDASTLQTACQVLEGHEAHERVLQSIRKALAQRETDPDMMLWIWRNRGKPETDKLVSLELLVDLTMISLEAMEEGGRLRAQNQIRDLFKTPTWVKNLLDSLSEPDCFKLMEKVKESSAWPELDRRSVLGLLIKTMPALQSVMTSNPDADSEEEEDEGPMQVTSERSFKERQLQLQKITDEDIPQNSKDIAVARSYGDLRENFEYQSAKDTQGMLMRRQAELEQMLAAVNPTDFADYLTDDVGPATGIRLRFEDGSEEQYFILGVWDQDDELKIISNETKLALALTGHKAGDEVEIPGEDGNRMCTLIDVTGLNDAIRAWIKSDPTLAG